MCYTHLYLLGFTWKAILNTLFILQKKFLYISTFSFQRSSNPLLTDIKLLKLYVGILESEFVKYFLKFSGNELPELVCSQFKLAHEAHTHDILKKSWIYFTEMSIIQYGNHFLHHETTSLWNKFFRESFQNHNITFCKIKSHLLKQFLQI